jgi:hypothetical protein
MKTITREYKTFTFDELSDESKEKVMQNNYDINTDYAWWDMDEAPLEIAEKYGLKIRMSEISFSIDRENYCSFETYNHGSKKDYTKGIIIEDYSKFIKKSGLKSSKALKEHQFYIDHKHYAGGLIRNIIEGDYDLSETECEKLQDCLDKFNDEVLDSLKSNYEYLTDGEQIINTIKANELTFLEDGTSFGQIR